MSEVMEDGIVRMLKASSAMPPDVPGGGGTWLGAFGYSTQREREGGREGERESMLSHARAGAHGAW
jgi:hypothetical protein